MKLSSIPNIQRLHIWSSGMDKKNFIPYFIMAVIIHNAGIEVDSC